MLVMCAYSEIACLQRVIIIMIIIIIIIIIITKTTNIREIIKARAQNYQNATYFCLGTRSTGVAWAAASFALRSSSSFFVW
jgi:hypothetical protein